MNESAPTVGQDVSPGTAAVFELRRAAADDVHRLKATLAEAFYDDPIFGWLMPDEETRLARLRRFFAVQLRHITLPRGCVWASTDLAGVALSMPPGRWRYPPRAALVQGATFGRHQPRAARFWLGVEARHLREPHYYIADIGVRPETQGKGLGSALMRPTLDRCDREGLPAYLEASSERSAALYERLGFRITRELRVGGSPPLQLMVRPPLPAPEVDSSVT
jgi:ribosomal protein S18 acetylase RimI-like enzyme